MRRRFTYHWVVFAAAFVVLLGAAGTRSTPGVLIDPLRDEFGWSRATVGLAVSINVLLYGFIGPFAAALQQYVSAAPGGFQAVGAKEFVDWTPSVVLPGAQSCRGSGYPRDPVVECVVYRTDSEVQAADNIRGAALNVDGGWLAQ